MAKVSGKQQVQSPSGNILLLLRITNNSEWNDTLAWWGGRWRSREKEGWCVGVGRGKNVVGKGHQRKVQYSGERKQGPAGQRAIEMKRTRVLAEVESI